MTGHFEKFSRVFGSFEFWVKATSARVKATKNIVTENNYLSMTERKILAHRYFFTSRDEESHSEGEFFYCIRFKNNAKTAIW